MTFALTPFSKDEQQSRHQFFDMTLVPFPTHKGWMKIFGGMGYDEGHSVQETIDGGYILTGYTESSGTSRNVWLIKTDSTGEKTWDKTFGGIDSAGGESVYQTTDGGYIITGWKMVSDILDSDVWLIKTDGNGEMVWSKTFGGTSSDMGYSVQQTTDDGYIITGYTSSFGAGNSDVWLIKTDSSGNMMWNRTFGGTNYEDSYSVQQTTDGGYIITGATESFGAGKQDAWLIKTDSNGNKVWDKTFGGIDGDITFSVQQTIDGGYIITGATESFEAGSAKIWLIKSDVFGDKVWDRTFGGKGYFWGLSVQQAVDGGYIIAGGKYPLDTRSSSDVWLIKTNNEGYIVWDRTFGERNDDRANSVQQTTDGGYIITGYIEPSSAGNEDVLLIKTDSQGKSKTISSDNLWFEWLFERFPNAFPILRQLLGY